MADAPVLIVEDTFSLALVYQDTLARAGIIAEIAATGKEAAAAIDKGGVRTVLLDLHLPDIHGLDILAALQAEDPSISVVVVTSTGSVNTAVEAMRAGAYDFMVKPVSSERLITSARNALERASLHRTVSVLSEARAEATHLGFIGSSPEMQAVYNMLRNVARSKATVFITGESGTGKEVCAEAIHKQSKRRDKPFVALNCAAIPKDLIESEIFGHVKGAFTGALSDREGAADRADGGTLFLDEICEMELALQTKLLRFLQTERIQKVGSDQVKSVDVRVVCATNRNPVVEVEEGRFREDLFYRLHVLPVHLPPLRDRGTDVLEIAQHFLKAYSREEEKTFETFAPEAEEALLVHLWPGNVRELQNVVRNIVVLNEGTVVEPEMVPVRHHAVPNVRRALPSSDGSASRSAPVRREASGSDETIRVPFGISLERAERQLIETTIERCDGSLPKAAKMLGVSPSTLYRKKEGWENSGTDAIDP